MKILSGVGEELFFPLSKVSISGVRLSIRCERDLRNSDEGSNDLPKELLLLLLAGCMKK